MADDVCVRLNSVNINIFYENNMKAIVKMTNPLNYNLSIVVIRILKVNHQSLLYCINFIVYLHTYVRTKC